ncbi:dihydroxyacetone kinase phosphoryl donor subunit DhaM [Pseudoclavibacter terrae]|uniref:Phosphocarrier protein HPr n=1 Tax=Pseudoclavibacter terrae TaxID=1530195 RepID=A0A7J5B2U1_9MICO|nr:dihydroxyacetone kinase phosphoryl donor subunit DhaM [Pseudoclavibacter terrae]KAB1638346.1 HPr family phosphocarrier protein [Pseudoclavibacter terrae]
MTVGIVVASHSARIAEGIVELAGQMAQDVAIIAAGGTDDGRVGTSFDLIESAVARAQSGDGVAVFTDLGSAVMTAETVLEMLDEDAGEVRLVDAPIVEGCVAAAVAAAGGAALGEVVAAGESAWRRDGDASPDPGQDSSSGTAAERAADALPAAASPDASARVTIVNEQGLHARPAAQLVAAAAKFEAEITIGGADADSLLRIISLGASQGQEIEVTATGRDADQAVRELAELISSGFGEA